MSDVQSTPDQRLALARTILGLASRVVDVPAHLKPIAGPIAETIVVKTLEGGDAQAIVAKVTRIADLAGQLIAELKD